MRFEALIFDFDGLMIESESIALKVWKEVAASLGSDMHESINRLLIGQSPSAGASIVKEMLALSIEASELQRIYWERRTEEMVRQAEPVEGLEAFIRYLLSLALKLGVASNSPTAYVSRVLAALHLNTYFETIVGSDQVNAGKPSPDIYLETANRLGVAPQAILVLEDSPTGVGAAVEAGMTCFAVPNPSLPGEDFSQAQRTFETVQAVHAHLMGILGR